jgi:hypothetical protein
MSNTTNTKSNNKYPFATKREILAQLDSSAEFRRECLLILHARQTADEQDTSTTKYKNARGFMSSHAVNGTRIAKALLAGEALSDEDTVLMDSMVRRYTKQLANHFREVMIANQPELEQEAAAFFKPQS